ncbi:MAG: SDR family oxidoreductase [Rhizobiales bacterium]|nr:SDR family oxidoreductase [Hyphomicrobiales bacterium]
MSAGFPGFRLDGKRALVTGAGRGIGLAISRTYAAAGADVILCARTQAEIEAAADELKAAGFKAGTLVADVTDVKRFADEIASLPAVDVFVNNAGTNRPKPLADVTEADFDAVFDLNVRAAVFAAKAVTQQMVALAIELGKHRIRVNTICPTFVETPMTKDYLADRDFRNFVLSKIKLGRLGTVEDVAGAALYLASDAASLMTGSALILDGGWTAG